MAYSFKHITAATVAAARNKPGHSDTLRFAPIEDFLVIQNPIAVPVNPGDKKTISTAHTFPVGKGFVKLKCKAGSVRQEGTNAVGEVGGYQPIYKYPFTVKGQSAVIEELLEELLNIDAIFMFNGPECGVNEYTQLGSECSPARIESYAAISGSKGAGGVREYQLIVSSPDHFYYTAAVTDQPVS